MSYKGGVIEDYEEILEGVQSWAHEKPGFDSTFIDSLVDHFERAGTLTEAQATALDNIIEKFGIEL